MKKHLLLLLLSSIILALLPAGEITSSSIFNKEANQTLNAKWLGGTISGNGTGYIKTDYTFSWNNVGNINPVSYTWKVNGVTKAYGGTSFTLNSSTVENNTVSCTVTYGSASYTSSLPIYLLNTIYYYTNWLDGPEQGCPYELTITGSGTLYIDLKQDDTNTRGTLAIMKNGTSIASTSFNHSSYSLYKTITVNKGDTIRFQRTITEENPREMYALGGHVSIYLIIE